MTKDVAIVAQHKQKVIVDLVSDDDVAGDDVVDLVSDSDDNSPGEEDVLTFRGPGIVGDDDEFDPFCVFPHEVALTHSQVQFLKDQVKKKEPTIPFYVCVMKKSTVKSRKAKMVILPT
jgi:azurin